jgi:hypothetical protein
MATEMLWVSLEERSRTNFPIQRFHSQPCYQIVRYFCRTLYYYITITVIQYHIYFLRLLFVRWTTMRSRWELVPYIWVYNLRCIASSNDHILWPEDGLTKSPKDVVTWNK